MHAPTAAPQLCLQKRRAESKSSTRCRTASRAKQRNGRRPAKTRQDTRHDARSRLRNSKPPSEHAPKPDKNQTKTQRHTAHEKCLTSLSEAQKKQDYYTAKATTRLHLEKMGPDASASNVAASATANHPREQAPTARKRIQSSRFRNSKPPSNHAPKPDKNQTKTQHHTAHEKCLTSLSEALKKEDYYTAKATTRLHLEKMGPDASASNVAASATANHPREQAPTARKRIQSSRFRNSKPPSNHAPKPDKNQTKTQHHTAHEKCLTSLSEALKKEDYYTAKATTRLHLEKMGPDASASNVAASAMGGKKWGTSSNSTQTHPKQPLPQQ